LVEDASPAQSTFIGVVRILLVSNFIGHDFGPFSDRIEAFGHQDELISR
jgi:hypothetical protein